MMALAYLKEIKTLPCNLSEFRPVDINGAVRFTFEHINDERNFRPVYINDDERERNTCLGFALSFYTNELNARSRIDTLKMSKENIRKKIGTHFAIGNIKIEDGISDEADSKGHFNLFTYVGIDLSSKFTIIDNIN